MTTPPRAWTCRACTGTARRGRADAPWRTARRNDDYIDRLLDEADQILTASATVWVADPGPQVLAVDDQTGRRWHRRQTPTGQPVWSHTDPGSGETYHLRWGELLQDHAPLTDATLGDTARG